MLSPIEFHHQDFAEPFEEETALLANFIAEHKCLYNPFIEVIRRSAYWCDDDFQEKYNRWLSMYQKCDHAASEQEISSFSKMLAACFAYAKDAYTTGKIRGTLAEKLVECTFKEYLKRLGKGETFIQLETGCAVLINGQEIMYVCAKSAKQSKFCNNENLFCNDCKATKRTVDIGIRELRSSKRSMVFYFYFAEVKVHPRGIHHLDCAYLKQLYQVLSEEQIQGTIFIITLDSKTLMEQRVQTHGLPLSSIQLVGKEELRKMLYS